MFNLHIHLLCPSHPSVPFWGLWPDCRGQAGRCDLWLPKGYDLSPHPTAASGSGDHQRGPGTGIHCQLAAALSQTVTDRETKRLIKHNVSIYFTIWYLKLVGQNISQAPLSRSTYLFSKGGFLLQRKTSLDLKQLYPLWLYTLTARAD